REYDNGTKREHGPVTTATPGRTQGQGHAGRASTVPRDDDTGRGDAVGQRVPAGPGRVSGGHSQRRPTGPCAARVAGPTAAGRATLPRHHPDAAKPGGSMSSVKIVVPD